MRIVDNLRFTKEGSMPMTKQEVEVLANSILGKLLEHQPAIIRSLGFDSTKDAEELAQAIGAFRRKMIEELTDKP